jgi:S1-C subfamily serine protease
LTVLIFLNILSFMKALLSIALAFSVASAAFGAGLTQVQVNGNSYSNITDVHLSSGGLVIIIFQGGGTSAPVDKVPSDFLASWKIGQESQAAAKNAQVAGAQRALDRAIQGGAFRKVNRTVYDTRKSDAYWVTFYNVKVIQVVDEGVILDTTPDAEFSQHVGILVKHLYNVSDTDYITVSALPTGTFSYVNKAGDDRTIRAYDVGTVCDRAEIPQTVLSGQKAFDSMPIAGAPNMDAVAALPESYNLVAAGSGFFVSQDGFFITNAHVVRNAHKIKVRTGRDVLPAEVIRVDDTKDLALLKVSGHFSALAISTNEELLGDSVFTIGFPDIVLQGIEPKYTDGKISSLSGLMDDPTEYQISVPVQPGNSGGPLVDTAGRVSGVIVAKLNDLEALRSAGSIPQNVNYAIKGARLRDFLSESPEVKLASPGAVAGNASAIASVRQSVAVVLVY